MRGSLSFMRPEPTWKNFFGNRKFATVKVQGTKGFKLISQCFIFNKNTEYSLYDHHDSLIKSWKTNHQQDFLPLELHVSCCISESPKIIYEYGLNNLIPTISSETETVSAVFEISGSVKRFKFQDIEVNHKDYDSEISFRAPDHQLYEAILIANLIYSPPLQQSSS